MRLIRTVERKPLTSLDLQFPGEKASEAMVGIINERKGRVNRLITYPYRDLLDVAHKAQGLTA
jgi:hypothetical protein